MDVPRRAREAHRVRMIQITESGNVYVYHDASCGERTREKDRERGLTMAKYCIVRPLTADGEALTSFGRSGALRTLRAQSWVEDPRGWVARYRVEHLSGVYRIRKRRCRGRARQIFPGGGARSGSDPGWGLGYLQRSESVSSSQSAVRLSRWRTLMAFEGDSAPV